MKKNFVLLAVCMLGMMSCLKDSYYEATYSPIDTFLFNPDADSLYFGPSFYGVSCCFMNSAEGIEQGKEADRLEGGFGMSSRLVRWNLQGGHASENVMAQAEGADEDYVNDNLLMSAFLKLDGNKPAENSYAVFYKSGKMPEHHIMFMMGDVGEWTPKSCMIANTAFTVARATGYDISGYPEKYDRYPEFEFSRFTPAVPGEDGEEVTPAKDGDFIRIVAKGYKGEVESGKTKEIYLVDYIDGQQDSVLTSWKTLDLSMLGEVDYVDFEVECSGRVEEAGFPLYFCLDNLASSVHVKY